VHVLALRALYRASHPAHQDVRQHELPLDPEHVDRDQDLGHLLREAGYYTAYKGKWHLTREFETVNKLEAPEKIFTKEMEAYGFSDYLGVGDIIAHTQGATCTTA